MPIPGYEGLYEASSKGVIRSLHQGRRTLRAYPTNKGYLTVRLAKGGKQKTHTVHRLIALAFYGHPAHEHWHACHNDGDKTNNRLENIRWDSPSGNNADKMLHGTNWQANKTHCPQGHPYEGDNVGTIKTGGRRCLACKKAESDSYYRSKRGDLFGKSLNFKLTPEMITEMKRLRAENKLLYREIGDRFGVTGQTARMAIQGKSWKTTS